MTRQEHIDIHVVLHKALDTLIADWMLHTSKRPSQATVFELMTWSALQTTEPDTLLEYDD